jgi:hypothetical protein
MDMDTTYRLVALGDPTNVGHTALTPELAMLVPGNLHRGDNRLGIERTDWVYDFGKPKVHRTILIEAEPFSGEWKIGPDADEIEQLRASLKADGAPNHPQPTLQEEVATKVAPLRRRDRVRLREQGEASADQLDAD